MKTKAPIREQSYSSSALFPFLETNKTYFFPLLLLLSGLAQMYRGLVGFKVWLYKKGIKKTTTLSLPVVSVGNLTVGGTGKTPILIYLTNLLKTNGNRIGIVSRNYKAVSKQIVKVQPGSSNDVTDGKMFGDEPLLIHQQTGAPVYVGPQKWQTAKEIVRSEKIDIVVVDDGFQHLQLKKNCNILLLDVTQMDHDNFIFPRGRYREDLAGYKKADILFWTKTNFVSAAHLETLKKQVSFSGLQVDWTFQISAIEFPHFPEFNYRADTPGLVPHEFNLARRFVLISAIARPEYFKKVVHDLNPKNEFVEKVFADHHQYSKDDVKLIMDKPVNFKHFLTTEKDYTKLKDIWPTDVPLGIVKWIPRPDTSDQRIYESIVSFLH